MPEMKKKTGRRASHKRLSEEATIKIAEELPHLTEAVADLIREIKSFRELAERESAKT